MSLLPSEKVNIFMFFYTLKMFPNEVFLLRASMSRVACAVDILLVTQSN